MIAKDLIQKLKPYVKHMRKPVYRRYESIAYKAASNAEFDPSDVPYLVGLLRVMKSPMRDSLLSGEFKSPRGSLKGGFIKGL